MRVYISGTGSISSIGNSTSENFLSLKKNVNKATLVPEWEKYDGLLSHVGAFAEGFDSKKIPRTVRRTMSKMSEMLALATFEALEQSKIEIENLNEIRSAINVGSSSGSVIAMDEFYSNIHIKKSANVQKATTFFKSMSHSAAVNLAAALSFKGPVTSTNSACASGAHTLILMWQLIRAGLFDVGIVGGCDEAHLTTALCFDLAGAASRNFNNNPPLASRPFDKNRDGLLISEGAGIIILESERHLMKRNGSPLAEVVGASFFCDSSHMSHPSIEGMTHTMNEALLIANLNSSKVNYINAHATSTELGDLCEAQAIEQLFKRNISISSLKGHMGHSFAASGSVEIAMCVEMMKNKLAIGTHNLIEVDPQLPKLDFLQQHREMQLDYILSNNFALGGINTSIILKSI